MFQAEKRIEWQSLTHLEFLAEFEIVSTFLFDSFSAYKPRLVLTIISGSDKVNASVNANNIANIGDITFLYIISYLQKSLLK